jgi:hypothetical protein
VPPAGSAQRPVDPRALLAAVAAVGALVVVASRGTWQLALLAGAAAAAVALTRMRYALPVAILLLAVVAALAVTDRTAGGDERPTRARTHDASQRQAAPHTAAERRHRERDRRKRTP